MGTNNTQQSKKDAIISRLEKLVKVIDKYGLKKVCQAIFVLFLLFLALFNDSSNQVKIVEMIFQKQKTEHSKALEYRNEISPKIKFELQKLLMNTGANRAFILEMHNGVNNPTGLPFLYAEMTYEEDSDGTPPIGDDYARMNVSRYDFLTYIHEQCHWYSTTDSLMTIDRVLANKIKLNDVEYLGCVELKGVYQPIGFLGISFTSKEPKYDANTIAKYLHRTAQTVTTYLDAENVE